MQEYEVIEVDNNNEPVDNQEYEIVETMSKMPF